MSTQVQTAVGRFVWHDHASEDPAKAKDFYTSLFGWDTEIFKPGEIDYPMIIANGQGHGGFGKAQGGAPPHWMGHVRVDDADAAAKRAESAGGTVLAGPMDIPEVGRFAAVRDPQGAVLSVFAPNDSEMPPSEGVFVWDELATSDVEGAKRFYGEVVGWTTADMDMGDMTYTMFRTGDADRAGCMPMMPGVPAPFWLSYIGTDDVDAT